MYCPKRNYIGALGSEWLWGSLLDTRAGRLRNMRVRPGLSKLPPCGPDPPLQTGEYSHIVYIYTPYIMALGYQLAVQLEACQRGEILRLSMPTLAPSVGMRVARFGPALLM